MRLPRTASQVCSRWSSGFRRACCSWKNWRSALQTSSARSARHAERQRPRVAARAKMLGDLGLGRTKMPTPPDLDEAGVVESCAELAQRSARRLAVVHEVLAVGGVEEIDVVATGSKRCCIIVLRELETRRRHGAAARARLEELGLVELPRFGGCAMNGVSTFAYWRRMPCSAKKKKVLASWRSVSPMLPETSIAKITAALVAGVCALHELAEAQVVVGEGRRIVSGSARRLIACFTVRRRSSRERTPRLSQPSRTYSSSSMRRRLPSVSDPGASAPPTASRGPPRP